MHEEVVSGAIVDPSQFTGDAAIPVPGTDPFGGVVMTPKQYTEMGTGSGKIDPDLTLAQVSGINVSGKPFPDLTLAQAGGINVSGNPGFLRNNDVRLKRLQCSSGRIWIVKTVRCSMIL